jgi:thymidylate synthase
MFTEEYNGVNSFLVGTSKLLLKHGVHRKTRGYNCWELPEPITIKIKNPTSRWVTLPERKWNLTLPYAESLWLASGRNDLALIGHYLKKMKQFSDDGIFMRAGYGPRLRCSNNNNLDFEQKEGILSLTNQRGDQFYYIEQLLKNDLESRRGIITINSPQKDCFNLEGSLKVTKDFPCTSSLHFMINPLTKALDLITHMRSNDFIWGASAVNIFNFTFIQEYFSAILGVPLGAYYHVVNNLHYYEERKAVVENLSKLDLKNVNDEIFEYKKGFSSLISFDRKVKQLGLWEEKLRTNKTSSLIVFEDDFFNDWAKILYQFTTKQDVIFTNPILNKVVKSRGN